jgi:hypothetical protein
LQGVGKDAVGVLRMIKRRLQAEMKTIGRSDLKMLSKLLQEDDLEVSLMPFRASDAVPVTAIIVATISWLNFRSSCSSTYFERKTVTYLLTYT